MTYVLTALAVLALLLLHGRLCRRRAPWAGAVLPGLWTVLVVGASAVGELSTRRDHLVAALVLVVLLSVWAEARERVGAAARPEAREPHRTDPVS